MNEQDKPMSKDRSERSWKSPSISEPSSIPSPAKERRRPYLNTASDGRVTLTFPSSGAWSSQYQVSPRQPARYEPITPASERSLVESNQPSHEKTASLRLMTDRSLAAVLDSSNAEPETDSNPGAGNIEAWIQSSRQTIIRQNGREEPTQEDDKL
ncbi:hypothetical protein ACGC1H_002416 [Rhizoctonia solani]